MTSLFEPQLGAFTCVLRLLLGSVPSPLVSQGSIRSARFMLPQSLFSRDAKLRRTDLK
jgi:hypothetical protein